MAKLTITDEQGRERVYLLIDTVTMAGRASSNSIQINDEKSSRQHFKIEHRDGGYFVTDLGSTNGTRLNGSKLSLPTELQSGDMLAVGKVTLTYHGDDSGVPEIPEESNASDEPALSADAANKPTLMADKSPLKPPDMAKPAPVAAPIYVLRIVEGATPGKIYKLGNEPLTLGRHPSNTIHIDDEAASNYHAEISREPVGYIVADLGSTNGTRVKPRNKSDFEKVVKTPLKTGTQIKIGKTVIEFQNVGAPAADDEPQFGGAAVDARKLDAQIDAATGAGYIGGGGGGLPLKMIIGGAAAILVLLVVGIWVILPHLKGGTNTKAPVANQSGTPEKEKEFTNLVPNSSFDLGIDEAGHPKEFRVSRGSPEVAVSVTRVGERSEEKPADQKHGLQISKGGAKSLLEPTVVEMRDTIPIEKNKTYEISGWMRNDDDGIFGMRIVWSHGERKLVECPIVLHGVQEEWGKEPRSALVSPPSWATHARIGVFVHGQNGKTWFDDLSFKEKQGDAQPHAMPVANKGIEFQFEGAKGAFSVMSQNAAVLEEGTLRLESPEAKAMSDLSSAMFMLLAKDSSSNNAGYNGSIFDFAQKELTPFTLIAKPDASGVDFNAKLQMLPGTTSKPLLSFYIASGIGDGDIEIAKSDNTVSRLPGKEDKDDTGVKSLLFNAGKAPQLNMLFPKPVAIHLKREGLRCLVEIRFDKDVEISMAPEDVGLKQEMLAALGEIKKLMDSKEKDWGSIETKLTAFSEKYSERLAEAKDEAAKTEAIKASAWKATQDEVNGLIAALQATPTIDLFKAALAANQRHAEAWKGSKEEQDVATMKTKIEAAGASLMNAEAEKKAEEAFTSAKKNFDAGIYEVAIAILKTSILDDPAMSKTKTADKARELLAKAEAAFKHQKDIDIIENNLRQIVKGLIAMKNYREAIKIIESDPEYRANKADCKELNKLLEDLKKKAG